MNELANIIGRPWSIPSDPPNTFECWSLTVFVRDHYGLRTPAMVQGREANLLDRKLIRNPPAMWQQISVPTPLCVVRMGHSHVGVYFHPGRVMHIAKGDGVRIDLLPNVGEHTFWEVVNA